MAMSACSSSCQEDQTCSITCINVYKDQMRKTAMIKRGLESLAADFIIGRDILMAHTLMLGYKKFK